MKCFVIIVTYNGMPWLKRCLDSCNSYKVIVVDNASTDDTVSFIRTNYPEVLLLEQTKNLGFGAANNIGIAHALSLGTEYVFLLNQDAYLQNENTINKLVAVNKKYPEYGVLSPIHLNGTWDKLDRNFSYNIAYDKNDAFYFDAIQSSFKDVYQVPFVNAAAWLVPKETLNKIGGFDPIFYHYGEDDNFCHRLKYHQLKVGVVPKVFIAHDREYRVKSSNVEVNQALKQKERILKLNWSNINLNLKDSIKKYKRVLIKRAIKSLLLLKFDRAKQFIIDFQLVKRIELEILESRVTNINIGKHYLD